MTAKDLVGLGTKSAFLSLDVTKPPTPFPCIYNFGLTHLELRSDKISAHSKSLNDPTLIQIIPLTSAVFGEHITLTVNKFFKIHPTDRSNIRLYLTLPDGVPITQSTICSNHEITYDFTLYETPQNFHV